MPNSLNQSLPAAWYPLSRSSDLKHGQVVAVQLGGERFALWRSEAGKVSALAATCCHVGANLSRGEVVGELLQCPLHHWCYDSGGACVRIPNVHAIPERARQSALLTLEAYGLIFGYLGGTPEAGIPCFEEEHNPVWSRAAVVDVAAPYTTLVANSYDGQHFAAVHDRELLEPPQITRAGIDHIAIHYRANVVGERISDRFMRVVGIDRVDVTIHCWGGSVLQVYNQRTANTILVALLPMDDNHSRIFILTVLKQRANGIRHLYQRLQVAISRRLAVSFLRPDMDVLEGVTMRPRVLIPGGDDCLLAWLRYWRDLPRPVASGVSEGQSNAPGATASSFSMAAGPEVLLPERLSREVNVHDA